MILLASTLLCGCLATPVPDPPDLEPPMQDRLSADPHQMIVPGPIHLVGEPGAALPGATVVVTPLHDAGVSTGLVGADGSFDVPIQAVAGEVVRLSLRYEGTRATPLDLIVPEGEGPMSPVIRDACLVLDPPFELEIVEPLAAATERAAALLRNDCATPVTLAVPRLRVPSAVVSVEAPGGATSLGPGESASVEVSFTAPASGSYEAIVLLDLSGAVTETRALTVYGRVPADSPAP